MLLIKFYCFTLNLKYYQILYPRFLREYEYSNLIVKFQSDKFFVLPL